MLEGIFMYSKQPSTINKLFALNNGSVEDLF